MSLQNDLALSANGLAGGGRFDPYRMHAQMPEFWASYLHAHYRGHPARIAVAFGVSAQTASNWLGGVTRPTGDKLVCDILAFPGRLERHMRRAIGERAA